MKILNGITLTGIATIQTNSLAVGTTQLVTANTNVGIGVTNPTSKLEVAGQTFTMILAAGQSSSLIYNDSSVIYANELYPYKLNYTGVNSVGLHNRIIKNLNGTDDEHVSLLNEIELRTTADSPNEGITALQTSIQPKNNVGTIGTVTGLSSTVDNFYGTGATITTMRAALISAANQAGTFAGATSYNTNLFGIQASGQVSVSTGGTSKTITDNLYASQITANIFNTSTYGSAGASVGNAAAVYARSLINGATVGSISGIATLLLIDAAAGQTNTNITNLAGISLTNLFGKTSPTYATNITNYYGLYMSGSSIGSNVNITNKYGIYQTDTTFPNYFGSSMGIGATSPLGLLHVSSGQTGNAVVIIEADTSNTTEGNVPQLWFKADGGVTEGLVGLNDNYLDILNNASVSGGIRFWAGSATNTGTANPYTGATQVMTITPTGSVGIGVTNPSTALQVSGTITGTTFSGALSGNATTATTLQNSRTINLVSFNGSQNITIAELYSTDDRTLAPADTNARYMEFGFGSWNNNGVGPFADFLNMRSYGDSSGGNDNVLMLRKDAIGMRVYQQSYGSTNAYATYRDVAFTDSPTFTGQVVVAAGTSAAPSITTTGDLNTGIFFPAADTIAFGEGGSEIMRIDSNGRVGIGIANPSSKLHIEDTTPTLTLRDSRNITWSTGEQLGTISFSSADTSGIGIHETGFIRNINDYPTAGNAQLAGALVFGSAEYNSAAVERMRITSSGNIGIGATNPSTALQVVGTITGTTFSGNLSGGAFLLNPSLTRVDSSQEGGQLNFNRPSDDTAYWILDTYGTSTAPSFRFLEMGSVTPRLQIDPGGAFKFNGSAGSSGQVLTSQGTSSTPIWTTISGAGTVTSVAATVPTIMTTKKASTMILGPIST